MKTLAIADRAIQQEISKRTAGKSRDEKLAEILRPLDDDLQCVTDRLMDYLKNPTARMVTYLVTAGGKRLRPALVLLAGHSGGDYRARHEALIDLAAAIELVHTATLIHDDIIDESLLRRKQPTFHTRFGTERAVLMGDYLYSVAFAIFAKLEQPYVTQYMAEVCQQLSRGELNEVDSRLNFQLTESEYLGIVRDKTASLIAACGHLGASVTGAAPGTVERVTQFGWNLGLAFQIVDDCLDLTGDELTVGKTLRSDLEKGSLSLPIIYLSASLSSAERERLFAPIRKRAADTRFLRRVAKEARERGAITKAMQTAESCVEQAIGSVDVHDGVVAVDTYRQLARYAIERVR